MGNNGSLRADIAERQLAEALAERDAAARRSYMVCTACYRTLSEETWRAIDLPKSQVRCPCGATGAWVRGHAFYRERAEAAETDNARLREALEPFALISSEGVVKAEEGHVTVTTCAEYFHRARAALASEQKP